MKRLRVAILLTLFTAWLGIVACSDGAVSGTTGVPAAALPNEEVLEPTENIATASLQPPVTFPYASPESQGLSTEALDKLTGFVAGYLEQEMIVGAELVVIKNRRIVLHEALGWMDREEELPMVRNTIFNIRSMTKPLVGTAIQMLVDEGKLALKDPVSRYLPAFDNEKSQRITIEHLLTHRSGLPYSVASRYTDFANIQQVAQQAGEYGPEFEPGTDFQYSDAGADALGAVVEQVSGVSLDRFLEQRILGPLSMHDTITLIDKADPHTSRVASAYVGLEGDWKRYWNPRDEPIYPFTVGSQSLYCTPLDYARFLALWMDGGTVGDLRLLSHDAIERALAPESDMGYSIDFPGLKTYYGQMWTIYQDPDAVSAAQAHVLFGHNGADGTWSWVWPGRDLIVLYFTQSRGQATGLRLEKEIYSLLIDQGIDEQVADVPAEYQPYLGVYSASSGPLRHQEFSVLAQNGQLALDIPNQIVVELLPPDERGLWRFEIDDTLAVSFDRDDAGEVIGMKIHADGDVSELSRGAAPPEPEIDLDSVQKYLGFYQDGEAGHNVEVLVYNDHLAIKAPESLVVLELYAPDEEGKWYVRLNPSLAISFNEYGDGRVVSFTAHTPDGDFVRPRVEPSDSTP